MKGAGGMRIAIASYGQETSSFSPIYTTLETFELYGLYEGDEILQRCREVGAIGGFINALEQASLDWTPLPLIHGRAGANGPLTAATLDYFVAKIRTTLEAVQPIDAMYFALHGAAAAENEPDTEAHMLEVGRSIIGDAGCLISKITYIKQTNSKNFVILDSAMNDMIRPALYGAKHRIIPSKLNRKKILKKHEFVGPVCESTDKFLTVPNYQKINQRDIIIICDVGAYGMVLTSNYNLRPKPAEILVNKTSAKIITQRQKLNNLI